MHCGCIHFRVVWRCSAGLFHTDMSSIQMLKYRVHVPAFQNVHASLGLLSDHPEHGRAFKQKSERTTRLLQDFIKLVLKLPINAADYRYTKIMVNYYISVQD